MLIFRLHSSSQNPLLTPGPTSVSHSWVSSILTRPFSLCPPAEFQCSQPKVWSQFSNHYSSIMSTVPVITPPNMTHCPSNPLNQTRVSAHSCTHRAGYISSHPVCFLSCLMKFPELEQTPGTHQEISWHRLSWNKEFFFLNNIPL